MFRTLLTPISARFSLSPSPQKDVSYAGRDDLVAEEFARDVLTDLMRNFVEKLKAAEGLETKTDALIEIHKIMLEDARTKDVFREMDGFLIVMSVLSTMHAVASGAIEEEKVAALDTTRLAFVILSEALYQHKANTEYFQRTVGRESLSQALLGLAVDAGTMKHTFGFLLSLALHKFSMSALFDFGRELDFAQIDDRIRDFEPAMGTVQLPEALRVLYDLTTVAAQSQKLLRYSVFKLLERLSYHDHRNLCVLNSMNLIQPLFNQLCEWKHDADIAKQERQIVQKLLRRLIDMGTSASEARSLFQQVVRPDKTLDADVLEVLRAAMKTRWPEHFSLQSPAAFKVSQDYMKGLPSTGFTFMVWIWIEKFPTGLSHPIFSCQLHSRTLVALNLLADGTLEYQSSASRDVAPLRATVPRGRWTHVTLVHYPHRASNPTIRIFVDGVCTDALNWQYPRPEPISATGVYMIGDMSGDAPLSWCIASAYLISCPLADTLPRFIHHLGPRYSAHFQTAELARFLTYDASTALHIHIDGAAQQSVAKVDIAQLQHVVKNGVGIDEASVVLALAPNSLNSSIANGSIPGLSYEGDIFATKNNSLDGAMWRIGGAAIPLRLVQLANSAHELSRALGILVDGVRNSWQNSEDMERLRGYDILAALLRDKSDLLNVTGFETLFEFLGLNFRSPDQSTIVNTIAYRAIALDFQLWSSTREEIQRIHLAHFSTLLRTSRYKRFNTRQRIAKMAVVRKLLFVLQTSLYNSEMVPALVEAIQVIAQAHFATDDAIKPIVSYLAANLHDVISAAASPRSIISRIDYNHAQSKAEQVLSMLVSVLQAPAAYAKFSNSLPVARICLLLLGERPTPATATQVLRLIGICLNASMTFSRKFELVSGWNVLKSVLPHAWSVDVQGVAFDVLFGRSGDKRDHPAVVAYPQILPAIFSSLKTALDHVGASVVSDITNGNNDMQISVENLLEELIGLHSTVPTFRHVFKSQATTQSFVDAYRSFVISASMATVLPTDVVRILEKLSHLGLSIALDNVVSGTQKQDIMEVLQSAETALNPRTSQETAIDSAAVVGGKMRRRRIASVRLSVQLGESTVKRTISRIHDWRKTVVLTERKRLRKMVLDLREYHRQIHSLTDWTDRFVIERGLWSDLDHLRQWQLDETEGPYRVRKKLEPSHERPVSNIVEVQSNEGLWQIPDADSQSVLHLEVPWAEPGDISSSEEENNLEEEIVDDKHRMVRHELEPGDVIEAASTVARIFGIDSFPGLLIFGRTHLYMLDGLVQDDQGEVVDAHDAPKKLFFVPGSMIELNGPQRAQRWLLDQVVSFSDRSFLFRDVGLEIYFKDSRSLLVVFLDKRQRQETTDRLSSIASRTLSEPFLMSPLSPAGLKSPLLSPMVGRLSGKLSATLSSRVLTGLRLDELSTAQRKWQAREISNFTYLSILNQISGRTPSDATQYPVFPWVLNDYSSQTLDLRSAVSYRDLTRPMGALTPAREDVARSRYVNLESVGEKPFHYGTHFSSSMIVCHFLIRLEPFSHMFKTLQGGDWDLPDRLFSDIRRAYESASQDIRGDVRELIPEFYSVPEFLENLARIDFGIQQNTGERIDDVKLPPWAKQDPLLFIVLNREALESDHVSEHLPRWIDLIWGCRQRDPKYLNVFHPLSYEGSINLDSITDELEREATVGIIHNFGQTPRKLFQTPHPERMMHGNASLPIGTLYGIAEDYHLLTQSAKVVKGPSQAVHELVFDQIGQRVIPCTKWMICVPSRPHEQLDWSPRSGSCGDLRVLVDQKVVQVVEATACSCAAFADATTLVTGSFDHTVRLWRLERGTRHRQSPLGIVLTHTMRAHTAEVLCVTASRAWSMVVSGSRDGSAVLWDLNRGIYIRSICHGPGEQTEVYLASVHESTGYVATCSRTKLCLHTINGRPIASFDLISSTIPNSYPAITSMAFLERDYTRVGVLATGGPDGTIALRTWNTDKTPDGEKAQWQFVTLKVLKVKNADGEPQAKGYTSCVTALKFVGESLYHGEDTGRVFSWDLPD